MTVTLTDKISYKKLIVCGNNEVWCEMTAGTMTELTTTGYTIDTSDQLMMFEGYQKAFVVNGSILGVADLVNTEIYDDTGFTNKPTRGAIVYQNGTSPATILVDYINGTDKVLYGYVMSGTVQATTPITSAVSGGGNVIFPSPTTITASPNWYAWTPYDNDTTTYGSMPSKAYLGCLYRGRTVLAGNPNYPQQWYMSRQANPWDWNTSVSISDAQRPITGSLGNAGESGDIIRALIPYKDDYLILGCSTSISIMTGDPAMMGPIDVLDLTTGIFGAKSWCLGPPGKEGGAARLYFWGTNGIYVTEIPGHPVCISALSLPDIVKDEAPDPSTYRISMAFGVRKQGILICITKLADGSNSNYWYDLRTEGFFPEQYPDECGAYSLLNYPANSPTYAGLLVGCKDGYIRVFDEAGKNDDKGATDEAIDSYVVFGPIQIAEDNKEGKIGNLTIITGGGAASGTHTDSNDIAYEIFTADTAEEVMEKLDANTAPRITGTATNSGKGIKKDTRKVRGTYGAIRLGNNTASETWSFEKLLVGK
jgi:hypothetical protein